MIKRRFYRTEHGDKDGDSSSSSDSEFETHSPQDSDADQPPSQEPHHHDGIDDYDDDVDGSTSLKPMSPSSSSSGYESEDSSANEIDVNSPDILTNDDEGGIEREGKQIDTCFSQQKNGTIDDPVAGVVPNCVLKCKSVFKCRFCPKIVCLNEESLNTHLKSKRHDRSEKLLNNGKLKRVLNSDGEEVVFSDDEDGETTHAERHARIMALAQCTIQKKIKGRQRQRQRLKRKKQNISDTKNNTQQKDNRAKRRRKKAESAS